MTSSLFRIHWGRNVRFVSTIYREMWKTKEQCKMSANLFAVGSHWGKRHFHVLGIGQRQAKRCPSKSIDNFLIFLIYYKYICCGYSLEAPLRQYMFSWINKKRYVPDTTSYLELWVCIVYSSCIYRKKKQTALCTLYKYTYTQYMSIYTCIFVYDLIYFKLL